jgi:pimeloyl-ACP methyl ester carboxylesterase
MGMDPHTIHYLAERTIPRSLLRGSFISSLRGYYLVIPILDGHSPDEDTIFVSVKAEADTIYAYLRNEGIDELEFIDGLSLGAIIAFEVYRRREIRIKRVFSDGGPFFSFGRGMKGFMRVAFGAPIKHPRLFGAIIRRKFPYSNSGVDIAIDVCRHMKAESIRSLASACYSFMFPKLSEEAQREMTFLYGEVEPANKSMPELQAHYPTARFLTIPGCHHCEYMSTNVHEYARILMSGAPITLGNRDTPGH